MISAPMCLIVPSGSRKRRTGSIPRYSRKSSISTRPSVPVQLGVRHCDDLGNTIIVGADSCG